MISACASFIGFFGMALGELIPFDGHVEIGDPSTCDRPHLGVTPVALCLTAAPILLMGSWKGVRHDRQF